MFTSSSKHLSSQLFWLLHRTPTRIPAGSQTFLGAWEAKVQGERRKGTGHTRRRETLRSDVEPVVTATLRCEATVKTYSEAHREAEGLHMVYTPYPGNRSAWSSCNA